MTCLILNLFDFEFIQYRYWIHLILNLSDIEPEVCLGPTLLFHSSVPLFLQSWDDCRPVLRILSSFGPYPDPT